MQLFDLAASVRPDGAAIAFDLLCVRKGLSVERLAGSTNRKPEEILRDLAWMTHQIETDPGVREAFARVEAGSGKGGRRPEKRSFLGSHPARTDGAGRLRIPAAFAGLPTDGGWLAATDANSGLLYPRPTKSTRAAGVPGRIRGKATTNRTVLLGPAWVDADVVVLGGVDHLIVHREKGLRRKLSGLALARADAPPHVALFDRIPTGLKGLDEALGDGLHRGELATMGAIPGAGLSTLSLQVALGVARRRTRVAWIGSHLDPLAVRLRMESLLAEVELQRVAAGRGLTKLDRDNLRRAQAFLDRAPILVACGPRTLQEVELCLRASASWGAALAVVDDVLFPPGHSRHAFARLRELAEECRLGVLVTTGVSRRASPLAPRVADVRAFAAASADFSSVVLVHRPSMGTGEAKGVEDEVVLLGTQGTGRLRWRRADGPRYTDERVRRGA